MPLPKPPTRPATILSFSTTASANTQNPAAAVRSAPTESVAARLAPEPASSSETTTHPAVSVQVETRRSGSRSAPVKAPGRAPVAMASERPALPIAEPSARAKTAARHQGAPKLFVLDTNVLLHDPSALFRFQEHDLFIPMMTLEELDNNKKGMTEVARNARQVSRSLDTLVSGMEVLMDEGIPLGRLGNRDAAGRLYLQTRAMANALPAMLPVGKADNQILGVVRGLQELHGNREVVLVSKDINMRVKARALGLPAEDYFNDQVLEDSDLLYSGILALPENFWEKHGKGMESWQQAGSTFYKITGPLCARFMVNQFVYHEGEMPFYAQVKTLQGKTAVLQTLRDFTHQKNAVWGVTARNREQNFALNLLLNDECDFVTLLGQAGTGKTLLALAAGLMQVLETKRFTEIIMTRATVPVGDDIGFLPGTEEEKMVPWMGALEDNLDVLNMGESAGGTHHGGDWGRQATMELIRSRIKVKSLNFMRGRTFLNKFLIIDEAQNLTPKQMKTLITRAGPGTKVICLGNIAQIDTPYLTEGSSGITYVVDRFKGWAHSGHVTLQRGERSRLADYAAEVL